jgi:hypothetical protein
MATTVQANATAAGDVKQQAENTIQGLLKGTLGGGMSSGEKAAALSVAQEQLKFANACLQTLKDSDYQYPQ